MGMTHGIQESTHQEHAYSWHEAFHQQQLVAAVLLLIQPMQQGLAAENALRASCCTWQHPSVAIIEQKGDLLALQNNLAQSESSYSR